MNQAEQNASLVPNESKVVSEIHELFERYGPTFVDLVVGRRSDINALLEFYGAPLRFIGPTFHMIMKDNAAITGPNGMGGEIDRLRQVNFAESTLDRCNGVGRCFVVASRCQRSAAGSLCGDLPCDAHNRRVANHIGSQHIGRKLGTAREIRKTFGLTI